MNITQGFLDDLEAMGVALYEVDSIYGDTRVYSATTFTASDVGYCEVIDDAIITYAAILDPIYGWEMIGIIENGARTDNFNFIGVIDIEVESQAAPEYVGNVTQSALDKYAEHHVALYSESEGVITEPTILPVDDMVRLQVVGSYMLTSVYGVYTIYGASPIDISVDGSKTELFRADEYVEIGDIYYQEIIVTDAIGSNLVYSVDDDKVRALMGARLRAFQYSQGGATAIDYGKFIINLMQIPFKVPSEMIGDDKNIQLADFETEVIAPIIETDHLEIDLGEVSVAREYGDYRDFKNTTTTLHAPFSPPITIDANYVIGQQVGVKYRVNLYTGVVELSITSSYVGGMVFDVTSFNLGVNVPLANYEGSPEILGSTNIMMGADNELAGLKIEVKRPYYLPNNPLEPVILEHGSLMGGVGLIRVNHSDLSIGASSDLIDMVNVILRDGVIIR